ncbi:MAG: family transporter [Alphaproteobacteria bacterium]|nr:family transporter [Alphaproteobacteria bacterium]
MSADGGSFLQPRILFPFLLVTLIWGSTWIVITDQLGSVPPAWSVAYRFAIAAAAMFAFARFRGESLRIGREGHALALLFGLPQFFLNYNFVYAAELHVTSGLVAVVFALLIVPNSLFAWLFLKQRATGGFLLGSAVALAGAALLFLQEFRTSGARPHDVLAGIGLTLLAVLAASIANVMQASQRLRRRPVAAMLAWGMLYGVAADIVAAWLFFGPPAVETRLLYWASLLYLALAASALAFALYFHIIRIIGPARAAYSSVLIPILAMGLSTLFEGYRWSPPAAIGGVLTLTGLVVALRSRRPAVPSPDG